MNMYYFDGKNQVLVINETVNNITVNGWKNKIYIKTKIPNIILNGSKNEINVSFPF